MFCENNLYRKRFLFVTVLSISLYASLILGVEAASTMWSQTYGGTGGDVGNSLVQTDDGGYAIAGDTLSYVAGYADVWLVKTDEYGFAPEATWIILPLLLAATLTIFVSKKRLFHKQIDKDC